MWVDMDVMTWLEMPMFGRRDSSILSYYIKNYYYIILKITIMNEWLSWLNTFLIYYFERGTDSDKFSFYIMILGTNKRWCSEFEVVEL